MPISVDASYLHAASLQATRRRVASGLWVLRTNGAADAVTLLISGTIRVEHHADEAVPTLLFRITGGDACILPMDGLLWQVHPTISAIAETDLDLLTLPKASFDDLMATSTRFRGLVFQANAKQLLHLMHMRDGLASGRTDGGPRG